MRVKVFFFFLICNISVFGQTASYQLKCTGLKNQFKYETEFQDSISVISEVNRLQTEVQSAGFFYSEIKSSGWTQNLLLVNFEMGPQFSAAALSNGNIEPGILSEIKFKEKNYNGKAWNIEEIDTLKKQLLTWYENHGYPFAEVWLDDFESNSQALSSKIYSRTGRQIQIDTLRMVGSARISQRYINAYLDLKSGEPYAEDKILAIDKRLQELPFTSQPRKAEVVFVGEKAKINIFLDKQNANQFDGLIGFLPSTSGKIQIIGDFKLKLQNAFKRAEIIDFNYRGLPEQSQELTARLAYPYILNTQLGLETDFQFYKRDTNFLNLNARIALAYNFTTDKRIGFFVENFKGNQLGSTTNSTLNINFGNVSTLFYGLQSTFQKLDNRLIPRSGYNFNVSLGAGKRNINTDSAAVESSQYKLLADLNFYIKLSGLAVLYLHNQAAFLSGQDLYDNEVFRIGGLKTFRGFDEQSILANNYSIQTIEFRYFLEQRSYLSLFYDQGIIKQNIKSNDFIDYPFGMGAGITFQTKLGLVSLSCAMGKQRNNPLDLQKGKIHFGIVSYF